MSKEESGKKMKSEECMYVCVGWVGGGRMCRVL